MRVSYFERDQTWLEQVGLGLTLWEGKFEGRQDIWLRWCDKEGSILSTGDKRAQNAEQRAELLAKQLWALGVEPDKL